MIEFALFYLTVLGGTVGLILIVLAIATGLTYLYRALEPKISEEWAIGINVIIVFLLVVLLFSVAFFFGGDSQ